MYHLAIMHSVTDRQLHRQTDDIIMPIAQQYDRLRSAILLNCSF